MRKFFALILATLSLLSCEKSGNTTPEVTPEPEVEPTVYKVGDLYDVDGVKGIVFRVDEKGESGLIVSLSEPDTPLAWSTELISTGSTIRQSGEQNTAIIYTLPNWEAKYPAFAWCKSLGRDWYIPSINELKELLIISKGNTFLQGLINNNATKFSSDNKYLSSTEMDEFWVYLADYATNKESANYKQYTYRVRAIHTF